MASKLLKNGTVISFDDTTQSIRVLARAAVLIQDDRIAGISDNVDQLSVPEDAEIVDVEGRIISPGFVNTHCHMWQTAYRTLGPNVTLMQYFVWPSQYGPASRSFSSDDIYVSSLEGYLEGLNAGGTSFLEHAHSNWAQDMLEAAYRGSVDSGARIWHCVDVTPRDGCSEEQQYEALERLKNEPGNERGLVSQGLALDGIGGKSKEQLDQSKAMIKKLDLKAVTIHYLGGSWPFGGHTSSPAYASDQNLQSIDLPVVFSHGGFVTAADQSALRRHNWNLSITPESEMHYGHGQSTSKHVLDQSSLGIDTNWTFSGDMITQTRLWLQNVRGIQYTETLQKGLIPRQSPFSVEEAFLLLTRQGGLALRRDDIGVLKVGAKADIVCINGDSPNMTGWTDPVAALVLHANVGDIEHVLVDGEFRKRDGKLVLKKGEWAEISKRFAETARRIVGENKTPPSLPDTAFGGQYGDVEVVSTKRKDQTIE